MKRLKLILWFLPLLLICCGGKQENQAWKGKIEKEGGLTVVNNPAEPAFGTLSLQLEEELSIGSEDKPETMLGNIFDLVVDEEGRIYFTEMEPPALKVFDSNGNYLKTIGGFGQGPGEYQSPRNLFIGPDKKTLYVRDSIFSLILYQLDGTYLKSITLGSYCTDFFVDGQGYIWGIMSLADEKGRAKSLEKIGPDGRSLLQVIKVPYENYTKVEGGRTLSVVTGYEYDLQAAAVNPEIFVYGFSRQYELTLMNTEGRKLCIIKNQQPARPIPPEEAEDVAKYLPIKEQPFFYRFYTDDVGRIWVLRTNPKAEASAGHEYDIYSRDGYYLYRTTLPYSRCLVIRKGHLWARHVDEEKGLVMIKRYAIKNWDLIKPGLK